jgi:hypothetical protein
VESKRAEAARDMRCSVTVERQSTTVPKTSKRRAFGGFPVIDITDEESRI